MKGSGLLPYIFAQQGLGEFEPEHWEPNDLEEIGLNAFAEHLAKNEKPVGRPSLQKPFLSIHAQRAEHIRCLAVGLREKLDTPILNQRQLIQIAQKMERINEPKSEWIFASAHLPSLEQSVSRGKKLLRIKSD